LAAAEPPSVTVAVTVCGLAFAFADANLAVLAAHVTFPMSVAAMPAGEQFVIVAASVPS
jgi:hypothetical protein